MSTTETSPVAPEVRLFLARVRHELADLDPEEVDEMTDGLEADLTELVADRGPAALGSPVEYADELRAAAGLERRAPTGAARRPVGEAVEGLFDAARRRGDHVLGRLPADVRPLLAWARPLWWVLRGWIAMEVGLWAASAMFGVGYYEDYWQVVPSARGWDGRHWSSRSAAACSSGSAGSGRLPAGASCAGACCSSSTSRRSASSRPRSPCCATSRRSSRAAMTTATAPASGRVRWTSSSPGPRSRTRRASTRAATGSLTSTPMTRAADHSSACSSSTS